MHGFSRQLRSYSTSTDNLLKESKAIESTEEIKYIESKEINRDRKINLNGLVFNIENNELRIDYSQYIDYKKAYESIELILSDIQKTDSKGFLNDTDLRNFPVISIFINDFLFKEDEVEIEKFLSGNKVTESYK